MKNKEAAQTLRRDVAKVCLKFGAESEDFSVYARRKVGAGPFDVMNTERNGVF